MSLRRLLPPMATGGSAQNAAPTESLTPPSPERLEFFIHGETELSSRSGPSREPLHACTAGAKPSDGFSSTYHLAEADDEAARSTWISPPL